MERVSPSVFTTLNLFTTFPAVSISFSSLFHLFVSKGCFGFSGKPMVGANIGRTDKVKLAFTKNRAELFSLSCFFKDELILYYDHISLISARLLLSLCATEPRLQASPYPLILSLENHCSVEQQTVMARHLRSILGDKLLTKPLDDISPLILPSPEVSRRLCSLISFPFSLQVY